MGPNSNQLQLQQRVRLATADCGCDCCNAHACNQCCKHLFLWLQQTGRATTILAASLLSVGMQFCGTAKVCRLPQHCSGCLVPGLYPSSASAAGHSCYPVASVVVVLVVVACTFCNQMRLTPTIVFGFSCCNIAAFYRCGKLATSNQQLKAGNCKYSFEIVLWSGVTDIAMAAVTGNADVYTNLEWLLKSPRHRKPVKTTHYLCTCV